MTKPRSYRLPDKTVSELQALAQEWDCTETSVLIILADRATRELSTAKKIERERIVTAINSIKISGMFPDENLRPYLQAIKVIAWDESADINEIIYTEQQG